MVVSPRVTEALGELLLRSVSMNINVVLIFYSTCSTENTFDLSVIFFCLHRFISSREIYLFSWNSHGT